MQPVLFRGPGTERFACGTQRQGQTCPSMLHDGPVVGAVLTKEESGVLSWSEDKTLRWWDAATGEQIGPSMQHEAGVIHARLIKDDARIVSWSFDKTVRLWDVKKTGTQIGPAMEHDCIVTAALLMPGETKLLTSTLFGQRLRLWDLATGRPVGRTMRANGAKRTVFWCAADAFTRARIMAWLGQPA